MFLFIFGVTGSDVKNMSSSEGSSDTEYDDVDEEKAKLRADSSATNPPLPPRPDSLLGTTTFLISD